MHKRETCPYCHGRDGKAKRAYPSKREAERTVEHLRRSRGVRLRAYQCEDTFSWHLTSDLHGGW